MADFVSEYDFSEYFTVETASALMAGLSPRLHPKGVPEIVKRIRDDANKGLIAVFGGSTTRGEIARWLAASGLAAEYKFDLGSSTPEQAIDDKSCSDPSELPKELDIANIAFRAVSNGHGDQLETFRSRVIDYISDLYPDLSKEAVNRIATVVNPDKSTGRKKRGGNTRGIRTQYPCGFRQ